MVAYVRAHSLLLAVATVLLSGAAVPTGNFTHQYYVKPNDTSPCPPGVICMTLAQYAMDPGGYFTNDTRMIFLPGDHSLNTTLLISNITNLAMVGNGSLTPVPVHNGLPSEPSSRVTCTASVAGIHFENITALVVQYITFSGCGNVSSRCYTHTALTSASALFFNHILNLYMSGVMVRNSTGVGFCGSNILGNFTITGSTFAFSYNGSNMELKYSNCSYTEETHLNISHSHFLYGNNVHHYASASGLAVLMRCTNVHVVIEHSTFIGNRAFKGGNLAISFHNDTDSFTSSVSVTNCHITNGSATEGGGMHVTLVEKLPPNVTRCGSQNLLQVLSTSFVHNYATKVGGSGMYFSYVENPKSYCLARKIIIENCNFSQNRKGELQHEWIPGGVAIHLVKFHIPGYLPRGVPQLTFELKNCSFGENVCEQKYKESAAVYVIEEPSVSITDCSFLHNDCTAITTVDTNILLGGSVTIQGNRGNTGGGIALYESFMYFRPRTTVLLADNMARLTGGAMHVEQNNFQIKPSCFFQLVTDIVLNPQLIKTVNVTFTNNTAAIAGDAVYGGSIDHCYLLSIQRGQTEIVPASVFKQMFHPSDSPNDTSFISSDPAGVCFCTNGIPDCKTKTKDSSLYPGQTLQTSIVVVGQRNGAVPGSVVAVATNVTLMDTQYVQYIPHSNCSILKYTISTNKPSASVQLENSGVANPSVDPLVIKLTILNCPLGFTLSQQVHRCKCNRILDSKGISCDIANSPDLNYALIHRLPPHWIGVCPYSNIAVLAIPPPHCPIELCLPEHISIQTTNDSIDQDAQCAPDRTGTLCGACKPGLSLTLGSYSCRQCSNSYIPILLSLAVGGLLLVVVLTALNLTVTKGTINGLIFYANIVHTNAATFFPPLPVSHSLKVLASIPQVFIAWINLDLGIESCFYNGMDAYAKTWLQFAFPIYIWVIAGMIVLLSRRYAIVARATGRHAVQVLATLFLLSFAKLQNVIIASMSFVTLSCEPKLTLWLPDGNLPYLQGKHIPLFVAAVVAFIVLSAPYTIILVFIQCLQRLNIRVISRLKPVIDAYTGPYKDKYRFWTGHLLLVRIILFVTTTFHSRHARLLFVLVVCLHLLLLSVWVFRGVYKNHSLDILESSFVLNLAILSAVSLYCSFAKHASLQEYVSYALVTTALLTFGGIVAFHIYKQVAGLYIRCASTPSLFRRCCQRQNVQMDQEPLLHNEESAAATDSHAENERSMSPDSQPPAYAAMVRFDQYREPVLGFEDCTDT